MELHTKRLLLRPWQVSDAASLYSYAKDPQVGPIAGWPVHTSIENSREIIQHILSVDETYAITLHEDQNPIGSVGLMIGEASNLAIEHDEAEIGYWIGVPFWGQGLVPEAVRELQRYAFEDLGMRVLWCAYFDGNEKSKRVQEKCGFTYRHTNQNVHWKALNKDLIEHVTILTKEDWIKLH